MGLLYKLWGFLGMGCICFICQRTLLACGTHTSWATHPTPPPPYPSGVRRRGEVKTTREKHNSSLLFSSIFYYGFPLLTLHLRRAAVRFIQQDIFTCPPHPEGGGVRGTLYTHPMLFSIHLKGGLSLNA